MDDMSVSSTVNAALALRDVNTVQEVQVTLLKKVLASQADTMATLMQSVQPLAVDSNLGSRVNTSA
ncbi:MAG: putative motility protein [Bordetella sp.]|nr:putative motility protein [Bordetella sp.]